MWPTSTIWYYHIEGNGRKRNTIFQGKGSTDENKITINEKQWGVGGKKGGTDGRENVYNRDIITARLVIFYPLLTFIKDQVGLNTVRPTKRGTKFRSSLFFSNFSGRVFPSCPTSPLVILKKRGSNKSPEKALILWIPFGSRKITGRHSAAVSCGMECFGHKTKYRL